MKRFLPVLVVVLVLAGALVVPASAGSPPQTVSYTVQPGDTLAKIGRQFCTGWQEIYALNRATIGPDPDELWPGMVLQVPNHCGGQHPPCNGGNSCGDPQPPCSGGSCGDQPPSCEVVDHGPTQHACGTIQGNVYTVAFGDTSFSVSRRFGLTVDQLAAANGLSDPNRIYGGQKLVIPSQGSCPPRPQPGKPFVTIISPAQGAQLPATFTVSGKGGGLFEGSLVVRALNSAGQVLVEQPTTLQGPDVGTGGTGTYSVQLTVNVSQNTAGRIVASATSPKDGSTVASAGVAVTFMGGTPPQPGKPFVTIISPAQGARLPATFTVSGRGGGLFEGSLVVRAVNGAGQVLAERPTTLQGPDVGTGGTGAYSVQLTVNVGPNTPGRIVALATSPKDGKTVASAGVAVTFTSSAQSAKTYAPHECTIQGKPGAPFYASPGGPQTGYFGAGGTFYATRGVKQSGQTWYEINTEPGAGVPSVWVPTNSTTSVSSGCAF